MMRPIFLLPLVCSVSLFAMSKQSSEKTTTVDQNGNETVIYEEDSSEEDIWYGPGFYYGIWFEDEDAYWGWRNNHRNYPPNHRYYNPHQPIHYHPSEDQHGGGQPHGGGQHGGEGRGGGGHGGGGHGGGGGGHGR